VVSYGGTVIEMLSVPTGHNGSNGKMGREGLSDCRLMDHKNGSDLVLTYKDKDGDWMLVGDVPWRCVIFNDPKFISVFTRSTNKVHGAMLYF